MRRVEEQEGWRDRQDRMEGRGVWTSFVPPYCTNRLNERKNTLGKRFHYKRRASLTTKVRASRLLLVTVRLEEVERTLSYGQKSCDYYGFIRCVKRLSRSYSGTMERQAAARRAGGIVAILYRLRRLRSRRR